MQTISGVGEAEVIGAFVNAAPAAEGRIVGVEENPVGTGLGTWMILRIMEADFALFLFVQFE